MPQTATESRVARALGSSALVAGCERVFKVMWRSSAASRSVTVFERARRMWLALAPGDRSTALGVTLLVAAAVHVGLVMTQQPPAGWLWLVPPAAAATIGVVSVWFSNPGRGTN